MVAVLIVAGLAGYAFHLTRLVKQKEQSIKEAQEAEAAKLKKQRAYIEESLKVISMNVIEEDLNLSEATIRCKVLIDMLMMTEEQRAPYLLLDEVYEQIKGFDTHQARKALTKQERKQQDETRASIEEKYEDQLKAVFTKLRNFRLPEMH